MYKILIVEDDMIIAESIKDHLNKWGYNCMVCENFDNVMKDFTDLSPELVLLDISLPYYNGYHWCTKIREVSKVPVIFISSVSGNMNIVMAMNLGADDFVTKPFDIGVLTAKVQAVLRRTYDFSRNTHLLEWRGAILNLGSGIISFDGEKTDLSKNEMRILQVLLENKGRVVERDYLMNALWETDSFVDENTLTVNVARLRKRLEAIGVKDMILTKKGKGYWIDE